jgi:transcriptional regulator with XRE-family HTH domain
MKGLKAFPQTQIRSLRLKRRLTQKQLNEALKWPVSRVLRLEQGITCMKKEYAKQLAKFFNVDSKIFMVNHGCT